jgi:hypothetical protein
MQNPRQRLPSLIAIFHNEKKSAADFLQESLIYCNTKDKVIAIQSYSSALHLK